MSFKKATAQFLLATTMIAPPIMSMAQRPGAEHARGPLPADTIKYANNTYLAYARSTSTTLNETAEAGLNALSAALVKRTSVEPKGVVGLNIEHDDISLFPFIYWPVPADAAPLSAAGQKKVQDYIDHDGAILFDVMDGEAGTGNSLALRRLLGGVTIKPLAIMDKDHTLTHSFYLMSKLPGGRSANPIWVESLNAKGRENVSSVMIGGNGWAAAWAGRSVVIGSREQELALRAGINFVMYALTGDYKNDAIHTATILDKLGHR